MNATLRPGEEALVFFRRNGRLRSAAGRCSRVWVSRAGTLRAEFVGFSASGPRPGACFDVRGVLPLGVLESLPPATDEKSADAAELAGAVAG